jgi:hypothetical protein
MVPRLHDRIRDDPLGIPEDAVVLGRNGDSSSVACRVMAPIAISSPSMRM